MMKNVSTTGACLFEEIEPSLKHKHIVGLIVLSELRHCVATVPAVNVKF